MQDTSKCHVSPTSGNIITPKGILSYTQFLVTPNKKGKYNLSLLLKPGSDLKELKNAMGKLALEGLDGDQKQAINFVEKRFTDPNDRKSGGKPYGPEFEGWTLVTASAKYMPDFVHPSGQKIPAEKIADEAYSGRWGRVTLNPYWMDEEVIDEAGNKIRVKGVFLGLVNVQLLDQGKPLGFVKTSGSEEFGAVEVEGGETPAPTTAAAVDALFG